MQQDRTTQIIDPGPSAYVIFLAAPREIGRSYGTLKNSLSYLGIEPICFHVDTCSHSISRAAMVQVKHLKREPALLAQRSPPGIPPGSSERKDS